MQMSVEMLDCTGEAVILFASIDTENWNADNPEKMAFASML